MAAFISGGRLTDVSTVNAAPNLPFSVEVNTLNPSLADLAAASAPGVDPLGVWATQPSVRKVVDFIARALASTPLKLYRRVSDTDRQRVTDHPAARVLADPGGGVTPFRFWHNVLVDWLLFDRYAILKVATGDEVKPLDLVRVQAQRVTFTDDGLGRVTKVIVDGRKGFDTDAAIYGHGYAPVSAGGVTPMRTLGAILQESSEAVAYRRGVWRNGARVPAVLSRPASAPDWRANGGRDRFAAGWRKFLRDGSAAGGTPILEDGMTLTKVDAFSPKDTNDILGRQLTDVEVAAFYHIAPELVGAREGTYSNVEAFRQMLYRDGLGPWYVDWEQTVNAQLIRALDPTGELYAEADVDVKLRGSFVEQAQVLVSSTGGPWLTRNEARSKQNLPAIDGGDELIVPLNVVTGGQASPTDSGSQNLASYTPRRRRGVKARAATEHDEKHADTLRKFFRRQAAAVKSRLGAKADGDYWDAERWDGELADELYSIARAVSSEVGADTLKALGYDSDDYDVARTAKFLKTVAQRDATNINATTLAQIEAALDDPDDPDAAVEQVFANADTSRAAQIAAVAVTAASGFGTTESVRQVAPDKAVKTWVTGSNPRASHASMDGETVGIDDVFSNGLAWPGDGGDADEVAGCNCGVEVSVE